MESGCFFCVPQRSFELNLFTQKYTSIDYTDDLIQEHLKKLIRPVHFQRGTLHQCYDVTWHHGHLFRLLAL